MEFLLELFFFWHFASYPMRNRTLQKVSVFVRVCILVLLLARPKQTKTKAVTQLLFQRTVVCLRFGYPSTGPVTSQISWIRVPCNGGSCVAQWNGYLRVLDFEISPLAADVDVRRKFVCEAVYSSSSPANRTRRSRIWRSTIFVARRSFIYIPDTTYEDPQARRTESNKLYNK